MKKKEKQFQPEIGDHETGMLVWQVSILWEREMKRVLDKHSLTYIQFVLLQRLNELESTGLPVSQIRLSQYANIEVMLTSKALRVLETKGFLKRKRDQADTRANVIALTDKGVKKMEKAQDSIRQAEELFFNILDNKRITFSKNLQKLFEGNMSRDI
jgi:MarR family transcriptional regulator, organic hydroperoxide resistance regulator